MMRNGGLRLNGIVKYSEDKKPLVSIITVVYNGESHLEMTIKSVIEQTYDNIEYIIIDGGSTDKTIDIICKYSDFIDYWISEPDKGIYDAFNKGLSLSTGEYIGFLNSDDWYEPDGIQNLTEGLKSFPAIYCGSMNLYPANSSGKIRLFKSRPKRLFQTMRIAHPASLVAAHIFDQIGRFSTDYRIAGDYDFFLRAKLQGVQINVIDKIISNMLRGGASKDLMQVFKEERIIKNKNLGNRIQHWVWYFANVILYFLLIPIKELTITNE
jgi:glycosyltransferase involved in cell wall biosynthesis